MCRLWQEDSRQISFEGEKIVQKADGRLNSRSTDDVFVFQVWNLSYKPSKFVKSISDFVQF